MENTDSESQKDDELVTKKVNKKRFEMVDYALLLIAIVVILYWSGAYDKIKALASGIEKPDATYNQGTAAQGGEAYNRTANLGRNYTYTNQNYTQNRNYSQTRNYTYTNQNYTYGQNMSYNYSNRRFNYTNRNITGNYTRINATT